jgi:hypothetical protein
VGKARWVVAATTLGWVLACGSEPEPEPEPEPVAAEPEPEPEPEPVGPEVRLAGVWSTRSGTHPHQLVDGDPTTYWAPVGDAWGDVVELRYLQPESQARLRVVGCEGVTPFEMFVQVDGRDVGTIEVSGEGTMELPTPHTQVALRSLASTACVAELAPLYEGLPAQLTLPHEAEARIVASSVQSPEPFHHPAWLFDGRIDRAWVEGAEHHGDGESVSLTFREDQLITAVDVYNGHQRLGDDFEKMGRVRKMEVEAGGRRMMLDLLDTPGPQRHDFDPPLTTRHLSFTLAAVTPGTAGKETALSELVLYNRTGPITVRPMTPPAPLHAEALKARVKGKPVAPLIDRFLVSDCGPTSEALFRSDHTFYVRGSGRDEQRQWALVYDGQWRPKKSGALALVGVRTVPFQEEVPEVEPLPSSQPFEGELVMRPLAEVEVDELQKLRKERLKAGDEYALTCLFDEKGELNEQHHLGSITAGAMLVQTDDFVDLWAPVN